MKVVLHESWAWFFVILVTGLKSQENNPAMHSTASVSMMESVEPNGQSRVPRN